MDGHSKGVHDAPSPSGRADSKEYRDSSVRFEVEGGARREGKTR